MNVPFVDLGRAHAPIRSELHAAAIRVIDQGTYIGGDPLTAFERNMAQWLGMPEVCGVSCATMGLFAALRMGGVGPGDEVITTVHTAIPTAEAVTLTGARVVFCDVAPGTFNLDASKLESLRTPRTRAVILVHLYGQPGDVDTVADFCRRHNLLFIEDCAQAQGARHKGKLVGTMGDAGVFSFFPSKNLGGFGDGGAVVARNPARLKAIRKFCNHGRAEKYRHEIEGVNSRLDTLQAALLDVCLPHLDDWNRQRRAAAAVYNELLAGIPGVCVPAVAPGTEPVYHVYVVLVKDREGLAQYLKSIGVATGLHYPLALNQQPAYAYLKQPDGSFPVAEYACAHMLSLPMFPGITRAEIEYVCAGIRTFVEKTA